MLISNRGLPFHLITAEGLVHLISLLAGACDKQAKIRGLKSTPSTKTKSVEASKELEKSEEAKLQSNSQNKHFRDPTARISLRTRSRAKALLESNDETGVERESGQLEKQPSSISSRTRSQLKH